MFLRPVFETISGNSKYWANFAAIVGYATSSRHQGRDYMRASFDVTVHRFIEMLIKLAPQVPREEIYWFYHLLSGSLAVAVAQTGRIDILSGGLCKSTALMSVLEPMKRPSSPASRRCVRAMRRRRQLQEVRPKKPPARLQEKPRPKPPPVEHDENV